MRITKGNQVVLVTKNKHKVLELTQVFRRYQVEFKAAEIEKVEIQSNDVDEVAFAAVERAYSEIKEPVVVDDTGLYINSLGGFPSAYAAFVLDTVGREGVLKLMKGIEDRRAKFVTAVGYCDGLVTKCFIGVTEGRIAEEEKGRGGFGYDSIFIPEKSQQTYAEMTLEEKTRISHRTKAFEAFLTWYTEKH